MLNKTTLSSIEFFSTLNEKELEELISFSTITTYSKDYLVHYEKQDSSSLVFLLN